MVTAEMLRKLENIAIADSFHERILRIAENVKTSSLEGRLEKDIEMANDRRFTEEESHRIRALYHDILERLPENDSYMGLFGVYDGPDDYNDTLKLKKAAIDLSLSMYDLDDENLDVIFTRYF
ncbi:MAG: hypothetical protein ACLFNK_05410 [Candidatus Woesearchaeota archaeon]